MSSEKPCLVLTWTGNAASVLKVIVQERDGHALVAVDGFADDSLVHAVAGQLADVLVAPTIVLDLAGAVITRPHAVRELAVRLAAGRAPWQVRIVCPRLTARRALRDALGGAEVAVVATVADAVAGVELAAV